MCVPHGLALGAVSKFDEEPFLGDAGPHTFDIRGLRP